MFEANFLFSGTRNITGGIKFKVNLFYFQELEILIGGGGINRLHRPPGNATDVKNKNPHGLFYITVRDLKTSFCCLLRGVPKSVLRKLL